MPSRSDNKDRVFVGTTPDGKVYKVAPDGKSESSTTQDKIHLALAIDGKGDLFVATGDQGEIHRVTPDGKGSVFFKSEETHVRSLALDGQGNLIAGTDPNALVLRISPAGDGFVLYEMGKREITAVAVAKDGSVYAAAWEPNRRPLRPRPAPSAVPAPAPALRQPAPPPPRANAPALHLWERRRRDDFRRLRSLPHPHRRLSRKGLSHPHDIIYSIGFDGSGRALIGTGNKGYIYRIDSDALYTALLNSAPTQVTAFLPAPNGKIYAATGNVGKVYENRTWPRARGAPSNPTYLTPAFSRSGPAHVQGRRQWRAHRDRSAQRQSRPAAKELERVVGAPSLLKKERA